MNVLSLFDGISCGQLSLVNSEIKYENYYSSEINEDCIKVTQHNFPRTIQLGDVKNIKTDLLPNIDLLIAGSPCQGFSFAGKQLNFKDSRSKLFFEFVRILKECNPRYFLLENVLMKKQYQDIISSYLNVDPILINSSLFSAQNRKRLYWTNIKINSLPANNNLTTEDILEISVDDKYFIDPKKSIIICNNEVSKNKIGYIGSDNQSRRIYSIHGKSVCLCGEASGMGAKTGLYAIPVLTPDRINKRQNGIRFKPPGSKFYTLTTIDKHGLVCGNYIRKLTPLECERLQTIPDNYTSILSDNKRYRAIGNAWTVNVISFILKKIKS